MTCRIIQASCSEVLDGLRAIEKVAEDLKPEMSGDGGPRWCALVRANAQNGFPRRRDISENSSRLRYHPGRTETLPSSFSVIGYWSKE